MGFTVTNMPDFTQMDANKNIVTPLFMGQEYMQYFDVLGDIKGETKIDHLGSLTKVTKKFNNGDFAGASTGTFTGVTISPKRVEAEIQFRANSLFGKVKAQLMRGNFEFDNIDGTAVKAALVSLIETGIKSDFNRQLFLSTGVSSPSGDYDLYDGIFESIFNSTGSTQLTTADITGQGADEALQTGMGYEILKALYDNASPALLEQGKLVYFVSGDIADDYMAQKLEATGYAAAGYGALVDGVPNLTYRGITILIRRDWDAAIAAESAGTFNGASAVVETHRAILTAQDAFIVGTDFEETAMENWYSQDAKAYRFRVSYMVGTALADKALAVCYTPDALA